MTKKIWRERLQSDNYFKWENKECILPNLWPFLEVAVLSMNSIISSMKIRPKWTVGSVAKMMPLKFVSSVM